MTAARGGKVGGGAGCIASESTEVGRGFGPVRAEKYCFLAPWAPIRLRDLDVIHIYLPHAVLIAKTATVVCVW